MKGSVHVVPLSGVASFAAEQSESNVILFYYTLHVHVV